MYAPIGAQPLRSCVPFNGRAVSYHSQQWHDVTITALRISVDLRDLLAHRNCFVNEIRVTLWSCALAIFSQEGENKILLIRGTRFLSIAFNFVDIRGVVQHKWLMVLICAMVQYFAFGERLMFYSTRLRPPPPPRLRLVE